MTQHPLIVSREDSLRLVDNLTKFVECLAVLDELAKKYCSEEQTFSNLPFDEPSHLETILKLHVMIEKYT